MIHVYQSACRCRSICPKLLSPHCATIPCHAVSATSELVPAVAVPAAPSALDPALPFLGRDLPQTTFARLPCTSIPFCADNASAARSAVGRLTKLTKAQSVMSVGVLVLNAGIVWVIIRDSRLASTMVMFRMSMGLRKGHVKTVAVRTSCSEHCGNPRKSNVVYNDELHVSTTVADSRSRQHSESGQRFTHHCLILWRLHPLGLCCLSKDLLRHRVIPAIVSIHKVLLLQPVLFWYLVSDATSQQMRLVDLCAGSAHRNGHSPPRLHSPLTKKEQMCGLFRL
jgi:hypothetical protein